MEKKTVHASGQDRPDILKRREDWFEGQPDLDPERLVFIDETWASTNMARRYGRAPKGERLRVGVPHGHVWTPSARLGRAGTPLRHRTVSAISDLPPKSNRSARIANPSRRGGAGNFGDGKVGIGDQEPKRRPYTVSPRA